MTQNGPSTEQYTDSFADQQADSQIISPEPLQKKQGKTPSLKETLESIKPKAANYCAIHFYISRLMGYNRQPPQIVRMLQIATDAFSTLNGLVYRLQNDDIVCIVENKSVLLLERAISQCKRGITNDPLISNAQNREMFLANFDLGFKWREFCIHISEIEDNPAYTTTKNKGEANGQSPLIIDGIKIETLSMIENILKQSDASGYIRRQSIHWYDGKGSPNLLSQHFYFSLPDLQAALKISESLSGNTWLFKQMTIYLDRQMIKILPTLVRQKCNGSLHINLNLRSLITSHFQGFIQNHWVQIKDISLTLCFDVVDVIAHTDVLLYGIKMLKEHNIKVCINNLTPLQMQFLNLKNIPVDLFKINNSDLLQNRLDEVKIAIAEIGAEKFILHKADDEKIIKSGLSLGISHFQGRGMDKLRAKIISDEKSVSNS